MNPTRLLRRGNAAAAFRNFGVILHLLNRRRWRLTTLIGLGLTASLAEGLSVGLIVGLLYQFLGAPTQGGADTGFSGALAHVFARTGPLLLATGVVVFSLFRMLVSSAYTILAGQLSASIADEVRTELYERFMSVPYAYVTDRGTGALLNILEWEAQSVPETVNQVANFIMDICALTVYAVLITLISWKIAAAAVVLSLPMLPLVALMSSGLNRRSERLRQSYETLSEVTVSTIEALRTLRLFRAESESAGRQRTASRDVAENSMTITRQQAVRSPIRKVALLGLAGVFLFVLRGLGLPRETTLTVFAILYRMLPHITALEGQAMQLSRSSAPLQNTLGILALETPPPSDGRFRDFDGYFDRISFTGVSFSHAAAMEPSLIEVDLTLEKGAFIAVTGPSGGGKTTLVNLLGRLYEPTSGEVLIDQRPLADIAPDAWLQAVAFAGQDVELLAGSILDNLRLGQPDLSLADAWEALTIVQAESFVRGLSGGLDTRVGDRGTKLSGGQRQRLVLARALARRPRLLILDEATNAVDPEMESKIYNAIRRARPALTILAVTHRGDTSLADYTVVIDRGRVRNVVRSNVEGERTRAR